MGGTGDSRQLGKKAGAWNVLWICRKLIWPIYRTSLGRIKYIAVRKMSIALWHCHKEDLPYSPPASLLEMVSFMNSPLRTDWISWNVKRSDLESGSYLIRCNFLFWHIVFQISGTTLGLALALFFHQPNTAIVTEFSFNVSNTVFTAYALGKD